MARAALLVLGLATGAAALGGIIKTPPPSKWPDFKGSPWNYVHNVIDLENTTRPDPHYYARWYKTENIRFIQEFPEPEGEVEKADLEILSYDCTDAAGLADARRKYTLLGLWQPLRDNVYHHLLGLKLYGKNGKVLGRVTATAWPISIDEGGAHMDAELIDGKVMAKSREVISLNLIDDSAHLPGGWGYLGPHEVTKIKTINKAQYERFKHEIFAYAWKRPNFYDHEVVNEKGKMIQPGVTCNAFVQHMCQTIAGTDIYKENFVHLSSWRYIVKESQVMKVSNTEAEEIKKNPKPYMSNWKVIPHHYDREGVHVEHPLGDDEPSEYYVLKNPEQTSRMNCGYKQECFVSHGHEGKYDSNALKGLKFTQADPEADPAPKRDLYVNQAVMSSYNNDIMPYEEASKKWQVQEPSRRWNDEHAVRDFKAKSAEFAKRHGGALYNKLSACKLRTDGKKTNMRTARCPFATHIGAYDARTIEGDEFRFCERRRFGREYTMDCKGITHLAADNTNRLRHQLTGKRIAWIGDSQIEQQFLGMTCLMWERNLLEEKSTKRLACMQDASDNGVRRKWGCDWFLDFRNDRPDIGDKPMDLTLEYNRVYQAQHRSPTDHFNSCNGDGKRLGWVSCGFTPQTTRALRRANVAVGNFGGHYLPESASKDRSPHAVFKGAWRNLVNDGNTEMDLMKEHLGGDLNTTDTQMFWTEFSPTHSDDLLEGCTKDIAGDFSNMINARMVPNAMAQGLRVLPIHGMLADHHDAHYAYLSKTVTASVPTIDCNHICSWPGFISASAKQLVESMATRETIV